VRWTSTARQRNDPVSRAANGTNCWTSLSVR
jgi:hypothetical protein